MDSKNSEEMLPLVIVEHAVASGRFVLTANEQKIFATVRETVAAKRLTTVVRVAGGWVRDKLLGGGSNDIDMALDDITGKDFAELINENLSEQGLPVSSIGVIQSAPEQSKHLEVATFRIHGQDIDMNNLRTETYTDTSRIPQIAFGTPWEDASRRDLTINALFYNINEDTIEDYSGLGLKDLEEGVIRTPCPPLQTFTDDPLRVLRAARFAGRFDFEVAPELSAAASTPLVQFNLLNKVTRERYGLEVGKMLKSPRSAVYSFNLLCQWGLYNAVFLVPPEATVDEKEQPAPLAASTHFVHPSEQQNLASESLKILESMALEMERQPAYFEQTGKAALLAAFLSPLWGYVAERTKKWKHSLAPFYIVRHSLKLPVALGEETVRLLQTAHRLVDTAVQVEATPIGPPTLDEYRLHIGRILREAGPSWSPALALADILVQHSQITLSTPVPSSSPSSLLRDWIETHSELIGCWSWKPLCNGKDMKDFGLKGTAVGHAISREIDWMLQHPGASRDECMAWLGTIYN